MSLSDKITLIGIIYRFLLYFFWIKCIILDHILHIFISTSGNESLLLKLVFGKYCINFFILITKQHNLHEKVYHIHSLMSLFHLFDYNECKFYYYQFLIHSFSILKSLILANLGDNHRILTKCWLGVHF